MTDHLVADAGANKPYMYSPEEIQQEFVSAEAGQWMASVPVVPDTGHLVVQESPRGLACTILDILVADNA